MAITTVKLQDTQRTNVIVHDQHVAQIAAEQIEAFIGAQFVALENIEVAYPKLSLDDILQVISGQIEKYLLLPENLVDWWMPY